MTDEPITTIMVPVRMARRLVLGRHRFEFTLDKGELILDFPSKLTVDDVQDIIDMFGIVQRMLPRLVVSEPCQEPDAGIWSSPAKEPTACP